MTQRKVAVIGGGWAGLAAAVAATRAGHQVTLIEASRTWGGRARAISVTLPDGSDALLDNGQHILIGAYTDTLALMRTVGMDPRTSLLRTPLSMLFPDGEGIRLPDWPAPLDVVTGLLFAQGWTWKDKLALLRTTGRWQLAGFRCDASMSVAGLCQGLPATVMHTLIEPLCVSALNTPPLRASGQVFLRVLKDALLGGKGSSNLLIPTVNLGALLPDAAIVWLERHHANVRSGQRVQSIRRTTHWQVDSEAFDSVVLATHSSVACQLLDASAIAIDSTSDSNISKWQNQAAALQYEAIATVYVQADGARLAGPMLALHCDAENPAQFVFDRGQCGGTAGLLAFVVSASEGDRAELQQKVLQQAQRQLSHLIDVHALRSIQTIVEKRATFSCTPDLARPAPFIAPGLLACGDYVDGPYPATLEGAVRSGIAAAAAIGGSA